MRQENGDFDAEIAAAAAMEPLFLVQGLADTDGTTVRHAIRSDSLIEDTLEEVAQQGTAENVEATYNEDQKFNIPEEQGGSHSAAPIEVNTDDTEWEQRLTRREEAIQRVKGTQLYRLFRLVATDEDNLHTRKNDDLPLTPTPHDRNLSKRQWEAGVMRWREKLRETIDRQMDAADQGLCCTDRPESSNEDNTTADVALE